MAYTEEEIMAMIDSQMEAGVGRLKVQMSEEIAEDEVKRAYHHGRCDVGSPWAQGKASYNCDIIDTSNI